MKTIANIYQKYQKFDNLLRKQRQAFTLEEKNKKDTWDNHAFFKRIYDATGKKMLNEFERCKEGKVEQ